MAEPPMKCWCDRCGHHTEHDVQVVRSYSDHLRRDPSATFNVLVKALSCRGCNETVLLREAEGGEPVRIPPARWRTLPNWHMEVLAHDPTLYSLLREVYSAANDDQPRLLAMGVRAALDRLMNEMVGDVGTFEQKLDEMVKRGHLGQRQREMLDTVIDAGSASNHRGFKPPKELLLLMLDVMETTIRERYSTGPMLTTLKVNVPPKPSRKKPTDGT